MSSRALIIAVTRLGDLIQVEPMIRTLKNSGHSVTLLVEKSFVDVASELPDVAEIKAIDFADVLAPLDQNSETLPLKQHAALANWLRVNQFSTVINVTHTRPSMVIAALANQRAQGVTLDSTGHQVVNNRWLQYFFAANLARPWCSFNLVDIYVNAIASETPVELRKPRLCGAQVERSDLHSWNDLHVLLHAGASQSDKQWPGENFVQLSRELLKRGARITLIGAGRLTNALDYSSHPRLENLIGRTSVRSLIDLCKTADLLVSADSGPVHIAAATNLSTIVIEGGSAHAFETAPYMENALVVQPHLENLMQRRPSKSVTSAPAGNISAQTLIELIEYRLGDREQVHMPLDCTVYRSAFDYGVPGLVLVPLFGSNAEYERAQSALRHFWWKILTKTSPTRTTLRENSKIHLFSNVAESAGRVHDAISSYETLEKSANALAEAEQTLNRVLTRYAPLHHLAQFLQIARSSLQGGIEEQSKELLELYLNLAAAATELPDCDEHYNALNLYHFSHTGVS